MSSLLSSIKPNNHKIHPCISERKVALCLAIISKNKNKNISFEKSEIFKKKNDIENVWDFRKTKKIKK